MTEKPPVCNYEGSDYQSSFWDQGGRAYEDAAEGVALRRLLPVSGKLMLELGAGAGRNTTRYHGYKRVVLVDFSRTQLQQAQERLGRSVRYTYVAADVYRLPFRNNLFDGATMIRTLHHMADPLAALKQVSQTLQKDAIFILEYANKQNLKAIARYLTARQKWNPFSHEAVEFATLNFDFHPAAIREWLSESQFEVERQLTVSHFRMQLFKRLFPLKWLVAWDSFAQLTGNAWQLSPSVFVRSRIVGEKMTTDEASFFKCPACGSALTDGQNDTAILCAQCGRSYPFQDGIYDFRLDV